MVNNKAQRKLAKLVSVLDAAYEALNDSGVDDDLYDALADMDEDSVVADEPGMLESIDNAIEALIQVLIPMEKYLKQVSRPAGAPKVRDVDGWPRKGE